MPGGRVGSGSHRPYAGVGKRENIHRCLADGGERSTSTPHRSSRPRNTDASPSACNGASRHQAAQQR